MVAGALCTSVGGVARDVDEARAYDASGGVVAVGAVSPLRVSCVVASEGSPDPLVDRGCSQGYWVCYGVTTQVAGATFHTFV